FQCRRPISKRATTSASAPPRPRPPPPPAPPPPRARPARTSRSASAFPAATSRRPPSTPRSRWDLLPLLLPSRTGAAPSAGSQTRSSTVLPLLPGLAGRRTSRRVKPPPPPEPELHQLPSKLLILFRAPA
uniref:Uncharacterized protein n=1 Tax=Aegilops tauschii subsp. strangulata TaxID=200361 RepID=A0A452ZVN2_AEGTS